MHANIGLRAVTAASIIVLITDGSKTAYAFGPLIGAIVAAPAPPSLLYQSFQSDTEIFLIQEQTAATVDVAIAVDVDGTPGLYDQAPDRTLGSIPVGTIIDVHLLHFDPISLPRRLNGSVTFSHPIVGLAFTQPFLAASDVWGAAGTSYPAADQSFRAFEFAPGNPAGDSATISPDSRTLSVDWGATQYYDELRVFTAVPEPAAGGLLAAAFYRLLLRRTRR